MAGGRKPVRPVMPLLLQQHPDRRDAPGKHQQQHAADQHPRNRGRITPKPRHRAGSCPLHDRCSVERRRSMVRRGDSFQVCHPLRNGRGVRTPRRRLNHPSVSVNLKRSDGLLSSVRWQGGTGHALRHGYTGCTPQPARRGAGRQWDHAGAAGGAGGAQAGAGAEVRTELLVPPPGAAAARAAAAVRRHGGDQRDGAGAEGRLAIPAGGDQLRLAVPAAAAVRLRPAAAARRLALGGTVDAGRRARIASRCRSRSPRWRARCRSRCRARR